MRGHLFTQSLKMVVRKQAKDNLLYRVKSPRNHIQPDAYPPLPTLYQRRAPWPLTTHSCHLLFVCLGNICRSPAAEAVLRAKAGERGLDLVIESAGTGGWHQGDPADARMIRAAARRGYRLGHHRARQIEFADFHSFDLLLAMDLRNQADLLAMAPPNRECDIRLFLDFADTSVRETPDPYYGGDKGFEDVLDLLEKGADALLDHIEESE